MVIIYIIILNYIIINKNVINSSVNYAYFVIQKNANKIIINLNFRKFVLYINIARRIGK